jgi:alpha-1,2-mannosyltransferase
VTWGPVWPIDPDTARWCGYLLSALLGLAVLPVLLQTAPSHREGGFYLWILYTLLVLPHIERYNHALLLPAMAWLWSQRERQRTIVIWVYLLTGLSRLNHLWVRLLPVPWGPLASGFGVYAVVLLGGGIVAAMWRASQRHPREAW